MSSYLIAAGSKDGTIRIYDSQDYEELFILAGHRKDVHCASTRMELN